MKTLSIKQPFAELILSGKKSIEIRSWKTTFRGEFLIHASQSPDVAALQHFGFEKNALARGAILGKATLVDVKVYQSKTDFAADCDKHLARSDFGTIGFILKHPVRFKKPIPAKGKLSFWEFAVEK
jgi:hypothetical protein